MKLFLFIPLFIFWQGDLSAKARSINYFECAAWDSGKPKSGVESHRKMIIDESEEFYDIEIRLPFPYQFSSMVKNSQMDLGLGYGTHKDHYNGSIQFRLAKNQCQNNVSKDVEPYYLLLSCGSDKEWLQNIEATFWVDDAKSKSQKRVVDLHFRSRLLLNFEVNRFRDHNVVDLVMEIGQNKKTGSAVKAFWLSECDLH